MTDRESLDRRAADDELLLVTDAMAACVTRCSRDLRYLWASRAYAAFVGRPREEIIGRPIREVVGDELFERLLPRFEAVLSGEEVRYEDQVQYPGQGRRWVEVVYIPTRDTAGGVDGWVAVVNDIEEHKRIEERLREGERLFTQFMESLAGLAWIKDLEGRYMFVNEAAAQAFRRPAAQIYGRKDEDLFPEATAAEFRANDRKALETGAYETIETLRHDDGILHHSLVSKFPILGADGKARGVGGMAIDITDRIMAEEALRESDRRKDEFLATLAHELRNPLAPIRNAVQIMRMPNASDSDLSRARDLVDRQVLLMVRLIDDLLDVSRISRNKLALRVGPVDVASVLQTAIETSRPAIDAARHTLTVTLPPEPVGLEADGARLAQVFSNLLNNAARYTEPGGHIWISAARVGGEIVVSVRDTGIGIEPGHLASLFEMFSQVTASLDRSQGGLGIGLALVRGLVELHGGRVEARSDGPGKGSEFVVRLPLGEPPAPAAEPAVVMPARPHLTRRILVVDDNEANAETLAMLLRAMGHDVRVALDGLEGVQAAAVFQPQVVLLDIGMPKMNGYEVARHIRRQPWGKAMTLIAMTGWGQEADRKRSHDAGFDRHLVKPVDPAALATLLDQRA